MWQAAVTVVPGPVERSRENGTANARGPVFVLGAIGPGHHLISISDDCVALLVGVAELERRRVGIGAVWRIGEVHHQRGRASEVRSIAAKEG